MKTERLVSHSPEETMQIAGRLALRLPGGSIVALHGELGSGKTCFVQGMARALGVRQAVTSPTFTIINEYRGSCTLRHVDLYRLKDSTDTYPIGFEEYMDAGDAITAIEWAERATPLLPGRAIHVRIENSPTPDERTIRIISP